MLRRLGRQLTKFALVGFSNTALTAGVYAALVVGGMWYPLAVVPAYLAGIMNGYTWNRRWTFRAGPFQRSSAARYALIQVTGLGATVALVVLLVAALEVPELLGQALATPLVVVLTFTAHRLWTFRTHVPEA